MDIQGAVKQYWPYALGGVVGLWLLTRNSGGSGGSGMGDAYAQFLASQSAAGAASAQAAAQLQAAQLASDSARYQVDQQRAMQKDTLNAQLTTNLATIEADLNKTYAAGMVQHTAAQAAMAESVGSSAAEVINALNAPSVAAIQSAALENSMALGAAADVAVAGFHAGAAVSSQPGYSAIAQMAAISAGTQGAALGASNQANAQKDNYRLGLLNMGMGMAMGGF